MKNKPKKTETEYEKELRRAYVNAFLSPEKDDTVSLEDDTFFENLYGKENFKKMKAERAERLRKEEKQKHQQ